MDELVLRRLAARYGLVVHREDVGYIAVRIEDGHRVTLGRDATEALAALVAAVSRPRAPRVPVLRVVQ